MAVLGPSVYFNRNDILARSLREEGAMALLCVNIDDTHIKLVGRWRINLMLRYLHVQAVPGVKHFTKVVITDREFSLVPNRNVPHPTVPLY